MSDKEIAEIKERLARLEEAVFGMNYEDARALVDNYIEATKDNPYIEASPTLLKAEKMLSV